MTDDVWLALANLVVYFIAGYAVGTLVGAWLCKRKNPNE